MVPTADPPAAPRSLTEPGYPQVGPTCRAILSLLLVDPGAFRTADEIARHNGLSVLAVRQALGILTFYGHVGEGWYVTDTGRESLAEAAP